MPDTRGDRQNQDGPGQHYRTSATSSTYAQASSSDEISSDSDAPSLVDDRSTTSHNSSTSRSSSVLARVTDWHTLENLPPVEDDEVIDSTNPTFAQPDGWGRHGLSDLTLALNDALEGSASPALAHQVNFATERYLRDNNGPWSLLDAQSMKATSESTRSTVSERIAELLASAGEATGSDMVSPNHPADELLVGTGEWVVAGTGGNYPLVLEF